MQLNTKKVPGRREVRYESLDELLVDAKRFSGNDIKTLGNWSQGQIFEHIARSMDSSSYTRVLPIACCDGSTLVPHEGMRSVAATRLRYSPRASYAVRSIFS